MEGIYGDVTYTKTDNTFTFNWDSYGSSTQPTVDMLFYTKVDIHGNAMHSLVAMSDVNIGKEVVVNYKPSAIFSQSGVELDLNFSTHRNLRTLNSQSESRANAISPYSGFTSPEDIFNLDDTMACSRGTLNVVDGIYRLVQAPLEDIFFDNETTPAPIGSLGTQGTLNLDLKIKNAAGDWVPLDSLNIETNETYLSSYYTGGPEATYVISTDFMLLDQAVELIDRYEGIITDKSYSIFRNKLKAAEVCVNMGKFNQAQLIIQSTENYLYTVK